MNRMKVNVFLIGLLLGVMLSFSAASFVIRAALDKTSSRDIIHLDKKFGTSPAKDAHLQPIVHLATDEGRAFCTAFVIDANYAATAAHCLDKKGKLNTDKLRFLDAAGKDLGVEVRAAGRDEQTDLGLLTGNFSPIPCPKK